MPHSPSEHPTTDPLTHDERIEIARCPRCGRLPRPTLMCRTICDNCGGLDVPQPASPKVLQQIAELRPSKKVLSELRFLRGLIAERDGQAGDIPVWLALEWVDETIKRVSVETSGGSPCQHDITRLDTTLEVRPIKGVHTLVCKECGAGEGSLRTPVTDFTSSNEYRDLAKEFIRLAPSTVNQELAIQLFAAWLDDRPAAEPAAAPGMVAELAKCVRWLIDDMPGCMIRGEAALAAYHSGTAHETSEPFPTAADASFKPYPCPLCGVSIQTHLGAVSAHVAECTGLAVSEKGSLP